MYESTKNPMRGPDGFFPSDFGASERRGVQENTDERKRALVSAKRTDRRPNFVITYEYSTRFTN
jgi:hypothetical protein